MNTGDASDRPLSKEKPSCVHSPVFCIVNHSTGRGSKKKLRACRAAIAKSRQRDALISRAVIVHPGYSVPAAVSTSEIGTGSEKDPERRTNLDPELRIISATNSVVPEEVAARAQRLCRHHGQGTHGELFTIFDFCGDKKTKLLEHTIPRYQTTSR